MSQLYATELSSARAVALISKALRGEPARWAMPAGREAIETLLQEVDFHNTAALLHEASRALHDWPEEVRDAVRERAIAVAFWEERHGAILRDLSARMAERTLAPIFLKGTALAYGHYPSPQLRIRSDTDLLVPRNRAGEAEAILLAAGFVRQAPTGRAEALQATYHVSDELGFAHVIDLHWEVLNTSYLATLFPYQEVLDSSVGLPALGPGARALGSLHAILLACVHREIHHVSPIFIGGDIRRATERLIWHYDLRILAQQMGESDWHRFIDLAQAKGLGIVCCESLLWARTLLGAPVPDEVLLTLHDSSENESAPAYLRSGEVRRYLMDFRAQPGLSARAGFLADRLAPSVGEMRRRYPGRSPALLPWLYLRRVLVGLAERLAEAHRR